jgi:protease-4
MLRAPFVLLLNLLGMIRWAVGRAIYLIARAFEKRRRYVKLELDGGYPFGHPRGLSRYFRTQATFFDLREDIKMLRRDPDVDGVVIRTGQTSLGPARDAQLVAMLDDLRESGKHVVAHADMVQTRHYLEATAADDIVITPAGRLYTFGPRFEQYFLADAFERHGIHAQFIHIGQFKVSANMFVQPSMPDPQREMLGSIREGLEQKWLTRVAERRRMPRENARKLFDRAPVDIRTARTEGLIDGEVFDGDLDRWVPNPGEHRHLPSREPDRADVVVLKSSDWKSSRPRPFRWRPLLRKRRHFALVDLSGFIVMPGMTFPGSSVVIDPDEVIPVLRSLAQNRRVPGVILHINSQGGSALASDMIWKAIRDLSRRKPVVAYCTDVAASGGYYLAVGADRIVCHPETVTGSIGVITGKFSAGDAAGRFGVNTQALSGDDGSELLSLVEPLGERVLQNLEADSRSFYRRFLQRVGQARHIKPRRLHRYARGRVYLGEQAIERDLVDDLGGFEAAVEHLRQICAEEDIAVPDDVEVKFVAHRKQSLKDAFTRNAVHAAGLHAVLEPLAVAALLRRDPTLALLPWRLV